MKFSANIPAAFDLHWLRSLEGTLRGTTGIRIEAEAPARVSIALSAPCVVTTRRYDRASQTWLRLRVECEHLRQANSPVAVRATIPMPERFDPLHLALIGEHPRQILRGLFKSLGGPTSRDFIQRTGVSSQDFATLAALWPTLTNSTEPLLWKAAQYPGQLGAIDALIRWLAAECSSSAALDDLLAQGSAATREWFEALSGSSFSTVLSECAFRSVVQAARTCLPLFQFPELEPLLRQIIRALPPVPQGAANSIGDLSQRLYESAGPALARAISADLSQRLAEPGSALLMDASFCADGDGSEFYQQALAGDFTALFSTPHPSFELHESLFKETLNRRKAVEIHLPFLFSASQSEELASVAGADIVTGADGRLSVVGHLRKVDPAVAHNVQQCRFIVAAALSARDREPANDNFSLAYSNTRYFRAGDDHVPYLQALASYGIRNVNPPAAPARGTLTLTLPGSVVQDWTRVTLSRSEALAPVLCRASLALQTALRRWLPALHLSEVERYANPALVLPLLTYQFSQPYARVSLRQYTYDSMDVASLVSAINSALPRLREPLARIQRLLLSAGKSSLASNYAPERIPDIARSVLRQKRHFAALLSADSFLLEQVLGLARYSRDLSARAMRDPRRAARDLHTFTREFSTVFHRRLSRLYARQDFTDLGSLILIEATAALFGRRDALTATFTITPSEFDSNGRAQHNQAAFEPVASPKWAIAAPTDLTQTGHTSVPPAH